MNNFFHNHFIVPPPVITEHPQMLVNATVKENVTFQCEAKSFGSEQALKYYWLKVADNGTAVIITGANTNKLEFIASPSDDSTFYRCGATNENSTTLSNIGRLNCK